DRVRLVEAADVEHLLPEPLDGLVLRQIGMNDARPFGRHARDDRPVRRARVDDGERAADRGEGVSTGAGRVDAVEDAGRDRRIEADPAAAAVDDVVVDEARRLHERVADRRPDETEAAPLQILAQRLRLGRLRRDLAECLPAVYERGAADEAPEIGVEAAVLLADGERRARVRDRRL